MRYLKRRSEFLNKSINEAYQNDITWGGSLLGRLINSTIRRGKIYYKKIGMNSLVNEVERVLDHIIVESGYDEDTKKNINKLKARFLIEEIYKVATSKDALDKKLTELLGDKSKNSGLINVTINEIEKIDESVLDGKKELIDKLEKFRDLLLDFDFKASPNGPDSASDSNDNTDLGKIKFNFYVQTSNLFKAVIGLNNVFVNKRVEIEKSNKELATNKSSNTDFKIGATENTPNKKEMSMSEKRFYEKESLPIFENTAIIKSDEVEAIAAWNKISKAYINANIKDISKQLKDILDKSKSGTKLEKNIVIAIGKQIIMNETTVGKPISFDQLIKEEAGVVPSEYKDIAKKISLMVRILLPIKEDLGLLGPFGEAKQHITLFIKSYGEMKTLYPNIKDVKENKVYKSFNMFKINEADDMQLQMDEEDGDNDASSQNTMDSLDKVESSWFKVFKKGEEKEWKVNENEATQLRKETDKIENKEFEIDVDSHKDRIIQIANLFGKAYNRYAVDVIPSGRPEGRISQKTFREYVYIGGGKPPTWSGESSPGYGPWGNRLVFEQWENGITKILEDTKYRKILANAKFKNVGPNQEAGSGKSLFQFINDMIGEGGQDKNFRAKRHRLLSDYFGSVPSIDKETKDDFDKDRGSLDSPKPSKEDYGDKKDLAFIAYSQLGRDREVKLKLMTDKEEYGREFFKITYTEGGGDKYLIGFIMGTIGKGRGLVLKFHKSAKKQSLISEYLKSSLDKKEVELVNLEFNREEPIYIGVIDLENEKTLERKKELNIKVAEITDKNRYGKVEDMKITTSNIQCLANFDIESGDWKPRKVIGIPDSRPSKDILNVDRIKPNDFGL